MDDLIGWLRDVHDQIEQVATNDGKLRRDTWTALEISPNRVTWEVVRTGGVVAEALEWQARHMALWDPASVLWKIQSERHILTELRDAEARKLYYERDGEEPFVSEARAYVEAMHKTARLLAEGYSTWPGYQESWRP